MSGLEAISSHPKMIVAIPIEHGGAGAKLGIALVMEPGLSSIHGAALSYCICGQQYCLFVARSIDMPSGTRSYEYLLPPSHRV